MTAVISCVPNCACISICVLEAKSSSFIISLCFT